MNHQKVLVISGLFLIFTAIFVSMPYARRARQVDSIVKGSNVPINFWGVIIDQEKRPVPEVKITFSVRQGFTLLPGVPLTRQAQYDVYTDAHGHFELTNASGDVLEVQSMTKPGYELSPKTERVFGYHGSSDIFSPDPGKPWIFQMWKKSASEKLVHFNKHTNIPVDGTPTAFDLYNGNEASDGALRIALTRSPLNIERGNMRYDITFKVEIVGGGLLASDDEFMNQAPEGGYIPSFAVEIKSDDATWSKALSRSFYFQTMDGKYGKLYLKTTTDFQPPPTALDLKVFVNPAGGRLLQYDGG